MRTSRKASSSGFTLIELSVIVLVLALLSALVVPRLVGVQRGIEAKLSLDAVQRLATRARETAMTSGRPVAIAYDDAERRFELRSTNEDGDSQVLAGTDLHPDIEPEQFFAGQEQPAGSEWTLNFYPDGTSDGGGVEANEGGILRSFVIGAKSGLSRWQAGGMPARETDRWQAGEFERRG